MSVTISPSGQKTYFTTSNSFEQKFGYHRAVRKGPFIFVSGTTSLNPETGKIDYQGVAYQQALTAMKRCIEAVQKLGGKKGDVVRVRMFVARQSDTAVVGEAFHHHFSGSIRSDDGAEMVSEIGCAATMVVVGKGAFVDEGMLFEIEVDAVVG